MKNVLVLYGGQSSEHDISVMSAKNIAGAIDPKAYRVIPVGITKEGRWLLFDRFSEDLSGGRPCILSPDATERAIYLPGTGEKIRIDVAFPVLHGLYGEDGTVQGLFELARIPYVGCNVLSSAVSMDKLYTKIVAESEGIRVSAYVGTTRYEVENDLDGVIRRAEEKLPYPVFVKPCCSGSSVGVGKAEDREELAEALRCAAKEDHHILIEERVAGREIECAVFGTTEKAKAYGVGEIITHGDSEFYDFDAKYCDRGSETITDPALPDGVKEEIMEKSVRIFRAVSGFSLARVDFFLNEKNEVVFNELNTFPGFTKISMFPMIMESAGMSKTDLMTGLIESAFLRDEHKKEERK